MKKSKRNAEEIRRTRVVAGPELRKLIGEPKARILDDSVRRCAQSAAGWRTSPALVRALQSVSNALPELSFDVNVPDWEREPYRTFAQALAKFTRIVAEEKDPKHPGLGLRPRRSGLSFERMVRWTVVMEIDSAGLKGNAAVKVYRLAIRDYLGRDVESEGNDFKGDARREIRRIRAELAAVGG